MGSGLTTISMHADEGPLNLVPEGSTVPSDTEGAARFYLAQALGNQGAAPEAGLELDLVGTFAEPLTGTTFVKFLQKSSGVPVYGSVATVELGGDNALVSISSETGAPNVSATPQKSAADVTLAVANAAGWADAANVTVAPYLTFYNDGEVWHLVWAFEGVASAPDTGPPVAIQYEEGLPGSNDFLVDANDGSIVARFPGVLTVDESAPDALGATRNFRADVPTNAPGTEALYDRTLNVGTYDFSNQAILTNRTSLPGVLVANPPSPWNPVGVSAHANASEVITFLNEILRRRGIDGQGSLAVSSINCVWRPGTTSWANAAWLPDRRQMVYGQVPDSSGNMVSYCVDVDIVAHEFFHGVTQATANLVYQGLPGALNESISDIFGVLIANRTQTDITTWNWRLGGHLPNGPIRDLQNPASLNFVLTGAPYPTNMSQYTPRPATWDNGGVHYYSSIHNLAFYNVITARQGSGGWTYFTPGWVAMLYYVTLSYRLSRTSNFADMRRGVVATARTLLRGDPLANEKVAAVEGAYGAVGIT